MKKEPVPTKKINVLIDNTTEEKIKTAAKNIFHQKGYAATRTRDIAEEAGINLALLNYYFRSKEKLFDIIMFESMQQFIQSMTGVFNNEKTTLEKKIETFVSNYIDLLIEEPDLPLFVLSELRTNPNELVSKMNMKAYLMNSYFMKQFQQHITSGKIATIHPLHFMMNIISLIVFPFVGSPVLKNMGGWKQDDFNDIMLQRKILIPKWIKAMMKIEAKG